MTRAVSKVLHQRFCDVYVVCASARADVHDRALRTVEGAKRSRRKHESSRHPSRRAVRLSWQMRGRNAQGGYSNEA